MKRIKTRSRPLFAKVAVLAGAVSGLGACVAPVADPVAYSGYPAYYDYPTGYGYPAYYSYPAYYGYPGYYYRPPAYYYAPPVFFGSVFFHAGQGRGHRR